MKNKLFFIVIVIALAFTACMKDEPAPIANVDVQKVKIETSFRTADISWGIESSAEVGTVVLEYTTDSTFATFKQKQMHLWGLDCTVTLDSLQEGTRYYARARVVNLINSYASSPESFETKPYELASISTDSVTDITVSSAKLHGTMYNWGTDTMPQIGFCVATHPNVTIEDSCLFYAVTTAQDSVAYMMHLNNLVGETTYYIRTFAVNSKGTSYGKEVSFSTTTYGLPIVTTSNVTNISYTTATCGGDVIDDGGLPIYERGICYSTFANPTIADKKVAAGNGLGVFTCNLSSLKMGVSYYVRAYATNNKGTNYGEEMTFTTELSEYGAIYYTSSSKLPETAGTDYSSVGLHVNSFNVSILSHDFEDGEGMIIFNGKLTNIGDYAFCGCDSLISVTIPNGVTNIGKFAFNWLLRLTSVALPNSVTSIGDYAFYMCGLTSFSFPNSLTKINDGVLGCCSHLSSLVIPDGVKSIGQKAFEQCYNLTSINIPNSVTSIGYAAFSTCFKLTSLTIPNSVTSIGNEAFHTCNGLTSITSKTIAPPACGSDAFMNVNKSIPLYVPAASISVYQQTDVWKDFTNILPINE